MATHSSILAWRMPWTEGPGRLQSMRSDSRACLHPGDREKAVLTDAENWSPHLAGWVGGGLPLDPRVESPD